MKPNNPLGLSLYTADSSTTLRMTLEYGQIAALRLSSRLVMTVYFCHYERNKVTPNNPLGLSLYTADSSTTLRMTLEYGQIAALRPSARLAMTLRLGDSSATLRMTLKHGQIATFAMTQWYKR